jgi:cytochrome c553
MMKKLLLAGTAAAIGALAGIATAVQAADGPPLWAYGYTTPVPAGFTPPPPNPPAQLDATTQHVLPGSPLKFTRAQIANRHGPADWFPGDHPPMPDIVSKGKQEASPPVFACGLCHYPNGKGRPENANVTGLNYDYIVQQLIDFRNGARKTSDPRKGNTGLMSGFAKNMTDQEIKVAAAYFAAIPATPWIRVVETATVPKSRPIGGIWIPFTGAEAGVEPIGDRILESPENVEHAELLRDPRSGFIAYVPPGSLKKGEDLVKNGATSSGAKITACTVCHGPDLRGIGQAPTIAGRSPSYLARQLYDMKVGNRNGAWTALMAPVVAGMGEADLLSASAYLASLKP